MTQTTLETTTLQAIPATSILAGVGELGREELCGLIVMLEKTSGLDIIQGAGKAAIGKLGLFGDDAATQMVEARARLSHSSVPDHVLRHRLWFRLAEALSVPILPPLSTHSARKATAALAVRASERLSPAVRAERKRLRAEDTPSAPDLRHRLHDALRKGADLLKREEPLSFPDLVREELVNLFADESFRAEVAAKGDADIGRAVNEAHRAAQAAIATGGGWAAFAVIVGNAGFAPYILAAKASAWIPLVGGPALVSLLATLINPATVMVGVAALGWLGMGRGASALRSQVASRICVLLAPQGLRASEPGMNRFLADMRALRDTAPDVFDGYLSKERKSMLEARLRAVDAFSSGALPSPAGEPPKPWSRRPGQADAADAALAATLTAGEMLWNAAAIDSRVLEAADFSRSSELGDPLTFAARAHEFLASGADVSLRGYTAEQIVLSALKADGHDVVLAATSNMKGFDILLNGKPVQIKCGKDIELLREHFEKYPDIPVIANSELAAKAAELGEPWADLITTLPKLEIATVEALMGETLGHAIDLAAPSVMEFAISIGLLRGGLEVAQGKLSIGDLPAWLVVDGAARGALGFVGGHAGGWLGLVVIGPAGALVLGPAIGCASLLGAGGVKDGVHKVLMRSWLREMQEHGAALHAELMSSMTRRVDGLERVCADFGTPRPHQDDLQAWMAARAGDDLIAALEERADIGPSPKTQEACMVLLLKAAELAPGNAAVLGAAGRLRHHMTEKPGLNKLLINDNVAAVKGWVRGWKGKQTSS